MSVKLGPFAAAVLAGCGGAATSLSGTIHGASAKAVDAASEIVTVPSSQGPVQLGGIVLSSAPSLCAGVKSGAHAASAKLFLVFVGELDVNTGQAGPPGGAGAYSVVAGLPAQTARFALVKAIGTGPSCAIDPALAATGVGGTVSLTKVSAGFAGTLSVDLQPLDASGQPAGAVEHVTGKFDAPTCINSVAYTQDGMPGSCH